MSDGWSIDFLPPLGKWLVRQVDPGSWGSNHPFLDIEDVVWPGNCGCDQCAYNNARLFDSREDAEEGLALYLLTRAARPEEEPGA